MANHPGLSRRGLMELSARALALPACAEFFAAWSKAAQSHQHSSDSNSAPPEPPLIRDYKPQFFNPDDFEALQSFTEILIPTDNTPGAREAHCAHYIDFVLQNSGTFAPEVQQRWRRALSDLKTVGFHSAKGSDREALIAAMSAPERDRSAKHPDYWIYALIKRDNTFAFYTSRAGMIEALDYRGNSYNVTFPACTHPEHHEI
jgi:hypothetical protein